MSGAIWAAFFSLLAAQSTFNGSLEPPGSTQQGAQSRLEQQKALGLSPLSPRLRGLTDLLGLDREGRGPVSGWIISYEPGPVGLGVYRSQASIGFLDSRFAWQVGATSERGFGWLAAAAGPFMVLAGSSSVAWGPALLGGLMFSEAAGPFERLEVSFQWRSMRFTRFVGALDGDRSVVASRLDVLSGPNLRLGFGEAIIMNGTPYAGYLINPVPWLLNYYISVRQRQPAGANDNYLLSFDFDWLPRQGLRVFGEVLIDDFTIPVGAVAFPSRWGLTLGAHIASDGRGPDLLLQYTIVPNWTYSAVAPSSHYTLRGFPLGHPLGADFDLLHVRTSPSAHNHPTYWGTIVRKGEGSVGRIWADESEARTYPFLRGVVEYSAIAGLDIPSEGGGWVIVWSPWVRHRWNPGHVAGGSSFDWGVGVTVKKGLTW